MAFGALESLGDPLIDPILSLVKDAINADILTLTTAASAEDARAGVLTTTRRPFQVAMDGEGTLPCLSCYRVRSKASQLSIVHVDHIETLQFTYATPACDQSLLDERWSVLDRVWRIALKALKIGHHPSHSGGVEVLSPVGVVRTNYATAIKREAWIANGGLTFPGFVAEVDVTWRPIDEQDNATYYPLLSMDGEIFVDTNGVISGTPDVIARAVTPAGTPPGRVFTRPSDWSL